MALEDNDIGTGQRVERANRKTSSKLFVVAVLMFGFGYALVPLYQVICNVTGLNGKTRIGDAKVAQATPVDTSRTIRVEFTGNASSGLPWEFRPMQSSIMVHPGEPVTIKYFARNLSGETIHAQATPSVVPSRAASHFRKIECFCFTEQTLAAGESKEMPVRFYVDPKVPKNVQVITLSYAFYNREQASADKYRREDRTHGTGVVQHAALAH